jgi:hypothetical protein
MQSIDANSFEQVRSDVAIAQYMSARRSAIAIGRRARFHIVTPDGAVTYSATDTKRGFGRRLQETEIERGY